MKRISIPKKELLKEHKRIIPLLKKHGLLAEAKRQIAELKEYKRK